MPVSVAGLLWPLLVYFGAVVVVVGGMLGISYVLGQRHSEIATGHPFEAGMLPVGDARLRLPIQFYLIAMFFVVFDLESVFVIAWAISWDELGWTGYLSILVFIVVLLVALAYLWRLGALDWGPGAPERKKLRQSGKDVQA